MSWNRPKTRCRAFTMVRSKEKGKRGERGLAKALFEHLGWVARRGQQYSGTETAADVKIEDGPEVHIEVKRSERLRLYDAIEQAEEDAGAKPYALFHRRNRKPWVAIIPLERLKDFLIAWRRWDEDTSA